jgi:uncharacterized protein (DUF1800 family)
MAASIDPRWAWEPYQPSAKEPWDLRKVGHLHRRAGFAATLTELEAGLTAGPEKLIASLLKGQPGQEEFDRLTAPLAESAAKGNGAQEARAWWLYRMLYTQHPLREKLTLFWHNHFATSNAKVQNVGFMLGQYQLMQRHALGSFRTMLLEMSKDPAMMIWLDTRLNKKGKPNENYAREVMELFSLGIGHYTERDIREAARAFTGWEITNGKAVFNSAQHDDGEKTVLGQTGRWAADDIIRICLEQKSAPYFIAGKLYRFLISETVPATPELVQPLADQFRQSDYNIGGLVETMLRSNLFFSPQAYRTRIKSPVDFVLGIVRPLEGRIGTSALAVALQELGQDLFHPPSVKGWDGGPAWLNAQTLLVRQNLALALTSTENVRFGRRTDPAALAEKYKKQSDTELVDFFLRLFLQDDVPPETRPRLLHYQEKAHTQLIPVYWTEKDAADQRVRTLCRLVLALPESQLD